MWNDEAFDAPDSPEALLSLEQSAAQEAPAEWRNTAIQCRQFYSALTGAGFSVSEAMDLVKVIIKSAAEHGLGNNGE